MNKPLIKSISSMLPEPQLSANEIMEKVHTIMQPLVMLYDMSDKSTEMEVVRCVLDCYIKLKGDVYGWDNG